MPRQKKSPLVEDPGTRRLRASGSSLLPFAHIDIPLYAIPDMEFVRSLRHQWSDMDTTLRTEAVNKASGMPDGATCRQGTPAHRECNWMASDPRPVKEWFLAKADAMGEISVPPRGALLKAFRDWRWSSGGPSSILLMSRRTTVREKRDRRDDLALLDVVAALPAKLRAGVNNPVDESSRSRCDLAKRASKTRRRRSKHWNQVLRSGTDAGSLTGLHLDAGEFGPRFPNAPDRVRWYPLPPPSPQRQPRPG